MKQMIGQKYNGQGNKIIKLKNMTAKKRKCKIEKKILHNNFEINK